MLSTYCGGVCMHACVCVSVGGGSLKRIPATTRILLGALIPQNLKHINFSLKNSEEAVHAALIPAKLWCLKRFTLWALKGSLWKSEVTYSFESERAFAWNLLQLLGFGLICSVIFCCLSKAPVIFWGGQIWDTPGRVGPTPGNERIWTPVSSPVSDRRELSTPKRAEHPADFCRDSKFVARTPQTTWPRTTYCFFSSTSFRQGRRPVVFRTCAFVSLTVSQPWV